MTFSEMTLPDNQPVENDKDLQSKPLLLGITEMLESMAAGQYDFDPGDLASVGNTDRLIRACNALKERLKQQEAFTNTVLNNLPADVAVFDPDHKYIFINPNAMTDPETREALIGGDDFDYCKRNGTDTALAKRRRAYFTHAVNTRAEVEWIEGVRNKNGEKQYTLRKLCPVYHPDGNLQYAIGYGIDVTHLKQTEISLAESEVYLKSLLKSIPDLIIRINRNGKCLDYRTADASMLIIPPDNFIGKTLHEILPAPQADLHMRYINEAINTSQLITYEYEMQLATGEFRFFEARMRNSYEQGIIVIIRDITRKKTREEENEKLIRELSHKYNELMQFNYIVSHNLRAPVANMLGMANLLKLPLNKEERKQVDEYMVQAAETMDIVISDLNAILSARSTLNEKVESFLLSDIILAVTQMLEKQIADSGAKIIIDLDPGTDTVNSIKGYIQSVILNLVSNALKYRTPSATPVIRINARKNEDHIVIEVNDNGIGIDLEKFGNDIFGLYKRFHTNFEGKGLGLYMTKVQLESLGGSIVVDSQPDVGTSFFVSLPEHYK